MVKFPYGTGYLEIELPNNSEIIRSVDAPGIRDVDAKLAELLNSDQARILRTKALKAGKILVIIPDNTRAFPTRIVLPHLLNHLRRLNREAEVKILIATGLHRPVPRNEVESLVGDEILESYEIENHSASDDEKIIDLGRKTSFGTPIEVNRLVLESDLIIGLGLIEPHFFAGYSGGRKITLPGIAGERAVFNNHSFKMIAHRNSRAGILDGNPIHEDMVEFARSVGLDFVINVTLNKRKEITGIFMGDPIEAHLKGVNYLDRFVKIPLRRQADIVITTNGGYPLDRDIYQATKGMDTGWLAVRKGGVIIIVSECRDGLGGHEEFLKLVEGAENPHQIIERIREREPVRDQWEAQILARILMRATLILVSNYVDEKTAGGLLMKRADSLEEALEIAYGIVGPDARILAIPEGPYVIPSPLGRNR